MAPSQTYALISLVVGVAAGVASHVFLDFGHLWGPLPWLVGAFATGTLYAELVKIRAHENLSDRDN